MALSLETQTFLCMIPSLTTALLFAGRKQLYFHFIENLHINWDGSGGRGAGCQKDKRESFINPWKFDLFITDQKGQKGYCPDLEREDSILQEGALPGNFLGSTS